MDLGKYTTAYRLTGFVPPRVEIVPMCEVGLDLGEIVSMFEPRACYVNAYLLAQFIPEAEYVEGEVLIFGAVPLIHAWNCFQGKHFDVTYELFSTTGAQDPHFPLVQGLLQILEQQGYRLNYHIDLVTQWLNSEKLNIPC